ncbi:MAG: type II toxin-antitoxin system HigB family toxin [Blastocatellia bacterium]|nr:type II toxin-antitoxin system HigB family toxin [Blastocatellia bacterium]
MRILSKKALREFWEKHPDAEKPLRYWYDVTKKADWNNFSDVRRDFRSADVVGDCVVFDIGGNKYRLITKIDYKYKTVYIRFVLTHKDYDKGGWKNDCGS